MLNALNITNLSSGHIIGKTIAPDQVVVILYDGQPIRVVGAGWAKLHSLNESFGPEISVQPQLMDVFLENMRSKDGFPFQVRVEVEYQFDPNLLPPYLAPMQTYRYATMSRSQLERRIRYIVENAARSALGRYPASSLRSGEFQAGFRGVIGQALHAEAFRAGFHIIPKVVETFPPQLYEYIMQFKQLGLDKETLALLKELQVTRALENAESKINHLSIDDNVKELADVVLQTLPNLFFPQVKLN